MNDHKPPRRERERLRHRQEILDAARQIVADRGIDAITVEQVARQAEFAVGSIYRHFASKEDLILAVVGDFADDMHEEMAAVAAEPGPWLERLDRFVRLSLQQQAECQPLFEAFLRLPGQLPVPGSEAGDRMMGLHARFFSSLVAMVTLGEEAGILRPGARMTHAVALGALLHGYSRMALMGVSTEVSDPAAEVVRSFLDGARARGAES
jgi:TetR/AcrR family transcriptional regulator